MGPSSGGLAEEALRRSEERFDLAVRGTDAGIWDWDLRTSEVYYSARWKSILGYAEDELRNEYSEWETRLHPDDRERAKKAIEDYIEGPDPEYELEHRLRHKDGTYRWILSRGAVRVTARAVLTGSSARTSTSPFISRPRRS